MNTCDLCFRDTRNRKHDQHGELLCTECRAASAYYSSLSPEELTADVYAQVAYADECERLGL